MAKENVRVENRNRQVGWRARCHVRPRPRSGIYVRKVANQSSLVSGKLHQPFQIRRVGIATIGIRKRDFPESPSVDCIQMNDEAVGVHQPMEIGQHRQATAYGIDVRLRICQHGWHGFDLKADARTEENIVGAPPKLFSK